MTTPRFSVPKFAFDRSDGHLPGVPFSGMVLFRSREMTFPSTYATTGPRATCCGVLASAARTRCFVPGGCGAAAGDVATVAAMTFVAER